MRNTNRSPKTQAAEAPAVEAPALESTAVAAPTPAGALASYVPESFTGFEDTEANDIRVPFLSTLQSNSPQVTRGEAKFIEGAQPSQLWNNLTNKLYDGAKGVAIVPVMRVRREIEYIPRNKGGGLVAMHDPKDPKIAALRKKNPMSKASLGDGNELVESVSLYCYMQDPDTGEWSPIIVPFTSTNMGVYQGFYSLASAQKFTVPGTDQTAHYPMFAHRWRLTTKFAKNAKGSWYKLALVPDGASFEAVRLPQADPVYQEAKQLAKLIQAGRVVEHVEGVSDSNPADEVETL